MKLLPITLWFFYLMCSSLNVFAHSGHHQNTEDEHDGSADYQNVTDSSSTPLNERIQSERTIRNNPYVITPHKPNFLLPFSFSSRPNESPFRELNLVDDVELDQVEMEFQVSLKVPLWDQIMGSNVALFAGYTARSYWQAYNTDISSPFRETNYEPEIWLSFPSNYSILGLNHVTNRLIFNHQSNGQAGTLSRSWNRIMLSFIFERKRFAMELKPWYRIPEDREEDDNPDIDRFLGNFEWLGAYKWENHTLSLLLRNNLRTDNNRGAGELTWSFPLNQRLKGYVKVFNGYGKSLIDYNASDETVGVGILLSDWF